MPGPVIGANMKLYYSTTFATPSWVLIDEIGDVNVPDLGLNLAELKRRASPYTKNLAALFASFNLEFTMIYGMDVAVFDVLRAAFFDRDPLYYLVADDVVPPESGNTTEGLLLPGFLEGIPWDQPLEEVSSHSARIALAYVEDPVGTEIDPDWYDVTTA